MPAHDWTRVLPDVFHDFHLSWLVRLQDLLNNDALPESHYALVEQHRDNGERVFQGNYLDDDLDPLLDFYIQKRRSLVIRRCLDDRGVAILEMLCPGLLSDVSVRSKFREKLWSLYEHRMQLCLINLLPPSKPLEPLVADILWGWQVGAELEALGDGLAIVVIDPQTEAARVWRFSPGERLPIISIALEGKETLIPLDDTYTSAFVSVPRHLRFAIEDPL